ncbi:hypothetical protein [Membranihabitans marinus]|uniref:hypothetical protein n=1 Tax=Membranihabitans marinus TaxID=1227546 RepID=UPI001F1C4720|nr:hypothetical protein [Membranihabitans marinus]
MKNLIVFSIGMLFASLIIISCQKNKSQPDVLEGHAYSVDAFFNKMSKLSLKSKSDNVIHINYLWNQTDRTITYLGSEEKPAETMILETADERKNQMKLSPKTYIVSCSGDTYEWEQGCEDKASCAEVFEKCFKEGGETSLLKHQLIYAPQFRTFYLHI